MGNPYQGEVTLVVDGEPRTMRLTLGAVASLEAKAGPILELVERFEGSVARADDVLNVLLAGLVSCGWDGDEVTLRKADIEGGYLGAMTAAAELLVLSFGMPND